MDDKDNGLVQAIFNAQKYMDSIGVPRVEVFLTVNHDLILKATTKVQERILEQWLSDSAAIAERYGMSVRQAQKYMKALPDREAAYIQYGRTKRRVCVRGRKFFRAKPGRRWQNDTRLSDYRDEE